MKISPHNSRRGSVSFGHQALSLGKYFPTGDCTHSYQHLTWQAEVQPLDDSRSYTLKLDYRLDRAPKVFVVEPCLLELSNGRPIPHLYNQSSQWLCLYRPNMNLWARNMFLSQTTVPWALTWLVFFELWLSTNEWHGRAYGHPGDDPTLHLNN